VTPPLTPDLTGAQAQMAALMADTCRIVRGDPGRAAATLNPATLQLAEPADVVVYDGKCLIGGGGNAGARQQVGHADSQRQQYWVLLPLTAPQIRRGDVLTVTASARDPQLVGARLVVVDQVVRTLAVARKVFLEAAA
jgi:hypothetical protein